MLERVFLAPKKNNEEHTYALLIVSNNHVIQNAIRNDANYDLSSMQFAR